MNNVVGIMPKRAAVGASSGSAGGPEGPDMEERVSKLEQALIGINTKLDRLGPIEAQLADIKIQLAQTAKATDVAEIKGQLSQMPKATEFGNLRADIAELKGKLSNMPTFWQLVTMNLTTWAAGAAIVFALLRITAK